MTQSVRLSPLVRPTNWKVLFLSFADSLSLSNRYLKTSHQFSQLSCSRDLLLPYLLLNFVVDRVHIKALIPIRITKTTTLYFPLSLPIPSTCLNMINDLISEVLSTEWALRLHLHPVDSTLLMEVMLYVTRHHYDLAVTLEFKQANDAVSHVEIFLIIIRIFGTLK